MDSDSYAPRGPCDCSSRPLDFSGDAGNDLFTIVLESQEPDGIFAAVAMGAQINLTDDRRRYDHSPGIGKDLAWGWIQRVC